MKAGAAVSTARCDGIDRPARLCYELRLPRSSVGCSDLLDARTIVLNADIQTTLAPRNWRHVLSAEDRKALGANGFLHIRAAARERELEAMRAVWARRMQPHVGPVFVRDKGNNDGPDGLEHDPAFITCVEHPYVLSAVAHVLDGDVHLLGIRGRNPHPGSGQQGFHVDAAGPVPADRQCMANAFWLLDDMDESNGATRLVPGTHRLERVPGKGFSRREAQHPEAVCVRARAGDVIVFSAHLWHAGSKNVSGAPRRISMAHFARREVLESLSRAGEGKRW